jgi:arabinogalactan endo-1,4-beta-galactosidase
LHLNNKIMQKSIYNQPVLKVKYLLSLILIFTGIFFTECHKSKSNEIIPLPILNTTYAKGADVGWLTEMEAAGKKFYNSSGVEQDCFDVLKSKGINSIRLRVWVNPSDGWNNKADIVAKAVRAKNKGLRIMIDFHYSDTWADPGHQTKPVAWAGYDMVALKQAVYDHTYDVLNTLKQNGVNPEWVQVGNEVDNGLLWTTGMISVTGGPANYAALVSSGYDAAKAVNTAIKVIVHVSNGFDNSLFRWNFDTLKNNGGKWDVIGMSVYPESSYNNYLNSLLLNMTDMISRYGKPVMISEVGMDVSNAAGCKAMLIDLMTRSASLGQNCLGVFYWEPESYNWKSYSKGAFDNTGKPTVAMDAFLLN